MTNARRRRARREAKRAVQRADRVKPSALAEAKKRPWPLRELLHRGPEGGGIDADQFEAALEIAQAYEAITKGLGFKPLDLERVGHGVAEMSDADAHLATIWCTWGNDPRLALRPMQVLERIVGEAEQWLPPLDVPAFRSALNLWATTRDAYLKGLRAERDRQRQGLTPTGGFD